MRKITTTFRVLGYDASSLGTNTPVK